MPINRYLGTVLLAMGVGLVLAQPVVAATEEDGEPGKWEEIAVHLPAFPRQQGLVGFYVSAATDNRFFVDPESVSVGADGVVRYTLVVLSASGVANVSFEGMRCETRERRLYAFGRVDGTWSTSRNDRWERVREMAGNRHHAALFQEYFCPDGIMARTPEEIRNALRRDGRSTMR